MKQTKYFRDFARQKHPEVRSEWIIYVLENPIRKELQDNGRFSFWSNIEDADGRVLRVITLEDQETVHNAFFDRNFLRRQQRGEEPK